MSDRHKKMLEFLMDQPALAFRAGELAELLEISALRVGADGLDAIYAKFRRTNTFAPDL